MRRLAIITMLLVVAVVPASASAEKTTLEYRAYGITVAGTTPYIDTFQAEGNPVEATGFYERVQPSTGSFLRADIDCLNVVDNTAYLAGVVTAASDPRHKVGERFYTSVTDNGEFGQGDLVSDIRLGDPTTCEYLLDAVTPITSGDVVVEILCDRPKDKPDSDKDKCKDRR